MQKYKTRIHICNSLKSTPLPKLQKSMLCYIKRESNGMKKASREQCIKIIAA